LKWSNLDVFVNANDPNKKKKILNNVSGYVKRGQMFAVMGPSGSGKTTLMAMLTKRMDMNKSINHSGKILMNNQEYDQKLFSSNASFILQTDILLETLTVRGKLY
jgi:ABC-type multidrug transport system ATPase subunit